MIHQTASLKDPQLNNGRTQINDWQAFCLTLLSDVQETSSIAPLNISDSSALINHLKSNGIACLLLDELENQNKTALLPQNILNQLQVYRRTSSVNELYNKQNLQQTVEIFNSHHIACLILKGSALAYSLYKQPYHRIRGDTDLLIRPADKESVDALLTENNYQKSVTVSGSLISHQNTYTKIVNGISHCYDVHWKLSNRNAFADLFDFEELYNHRQRVDALGENACRLSNIDALLHAVVHYYGHFPDDRERLIWIYDIHLLCSHMKQSQWNTLLTISSIKKLDPLVIQALLLSQSTFKTQLPNHVLEKLKQSPVRLNKIEQRRLTATHWSRIEQFKSDWAALSLLQRCKLIKEYLIPPSEFILKQNQSTNKLLLPYFYCKRILLGGLKMIKSSRPQ